MKFPTQFDKYKVESAVGSPIRDVFAAEYDEHGMIVLEKVGEENIYDEIQSHAESCDIYTILRRYTAGEVDVLNRVEGFYMDISELPTSYRDVLNMNIKTEQFFDTLPVEVKQEFGNSFAEFMVALGEKDFEERIREIYEKPGDSDDSRVSDVSDDGSSDSAD